MAKVPVICKKPLTQETLVSNQQTSNAWKEVSIPNINNYDLLYFVASNSNGGMCSSLVVSIADFKTRTGSPSSNVCYVFGELDNGAIKNFAIAKYINDTAIQVRTVGANTDACYIAVYGLIV